MAALATFSGGENMKECEHCNKCRLLKEFFFKDHKKMWSRFLCEECLKELIGKQKELRLLLKKQLKNLKDKR